VKRYALYGPASESALSYRGLVLVHGDRAELELLFPGTRIVELGTMIPEHDTMQVKDHPQLAHLVWPLRREDFKTWDTASPPPSDLSGSTRSGTRSTWISAARA
jgi:hypothetical protein